MDSSTALPLDQARAPSQDGPQRPAALAVLTLGYVVAFSAWYDELGPLAGMFAVPAALLAAHGYGVRVAWLAAALVLVVNTALTLLLGDRSVGSVLNAYSLLGFPLLGAMLHVLGRQRDLVRELAHRTRELDEARAALQDAERSRAQSRLNARLSRADRMASVGTLAAGVAHEINNPLTYVIGNLYYALEELEVEPADASRLRGELQELLRDALDGAERVRRIVRDLKTFSRADSDEADERIDVHAAVETSINLVRNEIRHRARLALDLEDVPSLPGNESRLVQVLVNLLMNASQSIQEGNAEAETISIRTRLDPAGHVLIEIGDTGCGMPREVQARIFDPFFTTKPVGVGTGLGLSVTHGIVTSMNGEIRVHSQPGQGSTFTVALPVEAPLEDSPAPRASAEQPAARESLRVLVVDDEPKVGVSLRRMLRPWQVSVCEDGREALRLLNRDDRFDAILCDLMMPHMTGMDLYERARAAHPTLAQRFVFMTGGAFTPRARAFLAEVDNECLEKPFDGEAVRSSVARALERAAPSEAGAA